MIIDFSQISIQLAAVHYAGNKSEDEGTILSKELMDIRDEDFKELLYEFFLANIKQEDIYQFEHHSNIMMNEMYTYCKEVFDAPHSSLLEQSVNILKHVYAQSESSPKIKGGEVYVVFFQDCLIEDELVDAIGIFKSENKHTYLSFAQDENGLAVTTQKGVNLQKLDKGALILNTDAEGGYVVLSSDMNATEANYWRIEVMNIEPMKDNVFHTKAHMNLCKDFVKKVYAKEVDQKQQSDFLNKAVNYFDTEATYDTLDFTQKVMADEEHAIWFKEHKEKFEQAKDLEPTEGFNIHKSAVKSMRRKLRNLIKLDTQVEIRINPNPEEMDLGERFVERGFDEDKNMHYYKIFFNQET